MSAPTTPTQGSVAIVLKMRPKPRTKNSGPIHLRSEQALTHMQATLEAREPRPSRSHGDR